MNNEETILQSVLKNIERNEIVFDQNDIEGKCIVPEDLKNLVKNYFAKLYIDSEKPYRGNNSPYNCNNNGYKKELMEGPIRFTSYSDYGYPKGEIHRIDIYNLSFNRPYLSTNSYIEGRDNYFYEQENKDISGLLKYRIDFENGNVFKIRNEFIIFERDKNDSKNDSSETMIFEFDSFDSFIALKNELKKYEYISSLLDDTKKRQKEIKEKEEFRKQVDNSIDQEINNYQLSF